ncbi:MAG: sialate O-acetylesterase [Verrucomicrobiota bacterium]
MKIKSLFILFALFVFTSTAAFANKVKIYIYAGQSNMGGLGAVSTLRDLPQYRYLTNSYPNIFAHQCLGKNSNGNADQDTGKVVTADMMDPGTGKPYPMDHATGKPNQFDPLTGNWENYASTKEGQFHNGNGEYGPELTSLPLLQANANETIYVVKYAEGGMSLKNAWNSRNAYDDTKGHEGLTGAPGDCYTRLIDKVNTAIQKLHNQLGVDGEVAGFFWMQGEADKIDDTLDAAHKADAAAAYEQNLRNLITDLRSAFHQPNMPFVFGETSDSPTNTATLIREVQLKVATDTPGLALAYATDLPKHVDGIHITGPGQQILGRRFALHYLALTKNDSLADGIYTIKNSNSNLMLDIAGASKASGAQAVQTVANSTSNQQWRITEQEDGTYSIVNVNSGFALGVQADPSVTDYLTWDNAVVIQGIPEASGTADQIESRKRSFKWWAYKTPSGSWSFFNWNFGMKLGILGNSVAGNASVVQSPDFQSTSQAWTLTAVASNPTSVIESITPNLLKDGGFESGNLSVWTLAKDSTAHVIAQNAKSGNAAAMVSGSGFSQKVTVEPNTDYVVSGWGWSERGGAVMGYWIYDANGHTLAQGSNGGYLPGFGKSYAYQSAVFHTPANATTVAVGVWGGGGISYFDDLRLSKNLISNGNLENGTTDAPWVHWSPSTSLSSNGGIFQTRCLMVRGSGNGTGAGQTIAVQANTVYTLSGWGYTGASMWAGIGYEFRDASGNRLNATVYLDGFSSSYSVRQGTFTTPANAASVVIQVWGSWSATGSSYFDDISLIQN